MQSSTKSEGLTKRNLHTLPDEISFFVLLHVFPNESEIFAAILGKVDKACHEVTI